MYTQAGRAWIVVVTCSAWLVSAACGDVARPDGGKGLLTVGAAAPDFEGHDADGKSVRMSTTSGARVVYFYPKDATPGCTKEACAFRDAFARYAAAGITIFGVSGDSRASHDAFRKEHRLPFPLVADESGAVANSYGVPTRVGMPARITFVVDQSGKIARVFENVDPGVHADEVLAAALPTSR